MIFFFEHFFSDFSTLAEVLMLPALPSFPSPPLLAFFRSTCIIGHQMFAFIEIEKTRLIWHKNILRYYFLWFFVMIVSPNTTYLFRFQKKPKNLFKFIVLLASLIFWMSTSNLVQVEDFFAIFNLINPTIQHTIFRALWWGKQGRS